MESGKGGRAAPTRVLRGFFTRVTVHKNSPGPPDGIRPGPWPELVTRTRQNGYKSVKYREITIMRDFILTYHNVMIDR